MPVGGEGRGEGKGMSKLCSEERRVVMSWGDLGLT